MDTLLRECGDYLALSLKSAEMVQSERQALKQQVIGEKEIVDEVKSAIRLVVQHAAAGTRSMVSHRLETHQSDLERSAARSLRKRISEMDQEPWHDAFARSKTGWRAPCATSLPCFPIRERSSFLAPLHKVRKQAFRALQQFRDRLSDRTMRAFGVPLRTTETEIDVVEPRTPDIRIGRVFDRNWELLSPILPVWMIKAAVRRHFARTISYLVYQNLSRLSTQWEESINGALWGVEKEARRRLDELIGTVERLVESGSNERAPQLRADLERLEKARKSLAAETSELMPVPVGGDWRRYRSLGAVRSGIGHHDAVRRKVPAGDAGHQCNRLVPDRLPDDHAHRTIPTRSEWRLLLVVGFLGGYTTFSSFEWETYTAVREGGLWTGMLNVVSSVMLGYIAVWLGAMLARR